MANDILPQLNTDDWAIRYGLDNHQRENLGIALA